MMLAIAIIAGIGYISSVIKNAVTEGKLDVNIFIATILILSLWNSCFPLAIITLVVSGLIALVHLLDKKR